MKVLIISPNWIGDAVMCTAVLPNLKDAHIYVMANSYVMDIWRNAPNIKKILPRTLSVALNLRKERLDICFLFPNSPSSTFLSILCGAKERVGYWRVHRVGILTKTIKEDKKEHQMQRYLKLLSAAGIEVKEEKPILSTSQACDEEAEKLLSGIDKEKIGIAPDAGCGPTRRWPFEHFLEVADLLSKDGLFPLFFSATPIKVKIGKTFSGLPLSLVFSLIKRCRLFIANDTGLAHVAAALQVPTITIFGASSPSTTAPIGDKVLFIKSDMDCAPCFMKKCKRADYACLKNISVERVYRECLKILEKF